MASALDRTIRSSAAGGKLENLTLWQRVYELPSRGDSLAERLRPGTELQEVALARELGVSRGPLREAIGRLAAEGLVTVRPRRGAVVRSLSRTEFLELYQVREALEAAASASPSRGSARTGIARAARADRRDGAPYAAGGDGSTSSSRRTRAFHDAIFVAAGQQQAARDVQAAGRPDGPLPHALGRASREPPALGARAPRRSSRRPRPATPRRPHGFSPSTSGVPQLRVQELSDDELQPILGPPPSRSATRSRPCPDPT